MDKILFIATIFIIASLSLIIAAMGMPTRYKTYEKYFSRTSFVCGIIGAILTFIGFAQ